MAYNYEWPYVDPSRFNSDWILHEIKRMIREWDTTKKEWKEFKQYVLDYLEKILPEEINEKLQQWLADGTLQNLIETFLRENGYYNNILPIVGISTYDAQWKEGTSIQLYAQGASFPFIITSEAGDISYQLKNGMYATYTIGKYDIMDVRVLAGFSDINEKLQELINSGYLCFQFPGGIFSLNLTLKTNCKIMGSHKNLTAITAKNTVLPIFSLKGDYVTLSDLYMYNGNEHIYIPVDGSGSFCIFRNIHHNGGNRHYSMQASCIWSRFEGIQSESAAAGGILVSSADTVFFNNNSFRSCRFNNEPDPINISLIASNMFANEFSACNIEYCTGACVLSGTVGFHDTYFEGNAGMKLLLARLCTFIGCCFINENALFDTSVSLNKKVMIGCYQYQSTNLLDNENNFEKFGCNF